MEIKYQEVKLKEIIRQYAQGFEFSAGTKIVQSESFVDTQKGVVIFKLYTEDS